jgi:hypothetical protein
VAEHDLAVGPVEALDRRDLEEAGQVVLQQLDRAPGERHLGGDGAELVGRELAQRPVAARCDDHDLAVVTLGGLGGLAHPAAGAAEERARPAVVGERLVQAVDRTVQRRLGGDSGVRHG